MKKKKATGKLLKIVRLAKKLKAKKPGKKWTTYIKQAAKKL
jgi:hypothetical protein